VTVEQGSRPGPSRAEVVAIVAAVALACALRSYPFLAHAEPTGGDYGHHLLYASLYAETGSLPTEYPYYQLGRTSWAVLPGGGMLYGLLAKLAANTPLGVAPLTALLAALEVAGIALLAQRVFRSWEAAATAALVAAACPAGPIMIAWSAYANLVALALLPFTLVALVDCWRRPGWRSAALFAVLAAGSAAVHHLSTFLLVLVLAVFTLLSLAVEPRVALGRLWRPALLAGALAVPVAAQVLHINDALGRDLVAGAGRFEMWRVHWSSWFQVATPLGLVLASAGLVALVRDRRAAPEGKALALAYAAACLLLGFGWLLGLRLFYMRSLYYMTPLIALGAAALPRLWRQPRARALAAGTLALVLALDTAFEAKGNASFYEVMTPGVRQGLEWLRKESQPGDVVVTGALLAFHAPQLLRRLTLCALPPELVGNPAELPLALDATTILAGLPGMDDALERRSVRYVVVSSRPNDAPDPYRSLAVLSGHPRLRRVFDRGGLTIFRVDATAR
jgi:hypothetical protein